MARSRNNQKERFMNNPRVKVICEAIYQLTAGRIKAKVFKP